MFKRRLLLFPLFLPFFLLFPLSAVSDDQHRREQSQQEELILFFVEIFTSEGNKCWCKDVGGNWVAEASLDTERKCENLGMECLWQQHMPKSD